MIAWFYRNQSFWIILLLYCITFYSQINMHVLLTSLYSSRNFGQRDIFIYTQGCKRVSDSPITRKGRLAKNQVKNLFQVPIHKRVRGWVRNSIQVPIHKRVQFQVHIGSNLWTRNPASILQIVPQNQLFWDIFMCNIGSRLDALL